MKIISLDYLAEIFQDLMEEINLDDFFEDEIAEYVTSKFTLERVTEWFAKASEENVS